MKIESFNDCKARGITCKGHGNSWLECEYKEEKDRLLLISQIDRLINEYESNTKEA